MKPHRSRGEDVTYIQRHVASCSSTTQCTSLPFEGGVVGMHEWYARAFIFIRVLPSRSVLRECGLTHSNIVVKEPTLSLLGLGHHPPCCRNMAG